jgi:hypothetical protein
LVPDKKSYATTQKLNETATTSSNVPALPASTNQNIVTPIQKGSALMCPHCSKIFLKTNSL